MDQSKIVWISYNLNGVPTCAHFSEEDGILLNVVNGRVVKLSSDSITYFDGTPVFEGRVTDVKRMEPNHTNIRVPFGTTRNEANRYQSSDSAPKVAVLERNSHNHY